MCVYVYFHVSALCFQNLMHVLATALCCIKPRGPSHVKKKRKAVQVKMCQEVQIPIPVQVTHWHRNREGHGISAPAFYYSDCNGGLLLDVVGRKIRNA